MSLERTPLEDLHKKYNAMFGEFAGWNMPLVYESSIKEHLAVRNKAGVFDISHMGRIMVSGSDALALLNKLVARELKKVSENFMSGPTAFLNENAGFKDDVMVYKISDEKLLVVCNAVNRKKVLKWIETWRDTWGLKVSIEDLTHKIAMIALQGPDSARILEALGIKEALGLKLLEFMTGIKTSEYGEIFLLSRSGWTGEDGFEIMAEPGAIYKIFEKIVEQGVAPAGLIARDSLRIEMGFMLYGNEIDENITPIEARYWVFTPEKKDYIGYEALRRKMREGVDKILVGLKLKKGERSIPRHGYKVLVDDVIIGEVTSGTFSPTLNRSIALAYIDSKHAVFGLEVGVDIRGRIRKAKIVDTPFIKR